MLTDSITTTQDTQNSESLLTQGKASIRSEIKSLENLERKLDDNFEVAVRAILACKGRVVVTGIGKSGHIGNKIAATLASTGTPAFFVHPAEACHGDLGMITADDLVLAISNSGQGQEILTMVPVLKRIGAQIIAITAKPESPLAKTADLTLDIHCPTEACPLGLAPTNSTTNTLALGDALAITLLNAKGFQHADFALSHPSGALGKKLLTRVQDIMLPLTDTPCVTPETNLKTTLLEISTKRLGFAVVIGHNHELQGIFTDGDLRRIFESDCNLQTTTIVEVMTQSPVTINPEQLAVDAVNIMQARAITAIVVVDDQNKVIGTINFHELLKAGIM